MTVSKTALYDYRDRMAPLLATWNEQLVQRAMAEELVEGHQASLDGTTVAANASRRKLVNLPQVEKRLELLDQALTEPRPAETRALDESLPDAPATPGWMARTTTGRQEQRQRCQKAKQRLAALHEENSHRRSDKRKPPEKIVVSISDPESVFGLDKEKVYRPLYNAQTISDLAADFVLGYEVFDRHTDSGTLQPMIRKLLAQQIPIEAVLADAGYPVGEDLAFCEQAGITLYAPWQENGLTAQKKPCDQPDASINKNQFQWISEREVYICPADKELPHSHRKSRQRASGETIHFDVYRASPLDCRQCPLQPGCTTAPESGRTVRRDPHQDEIDRLNARMETEEAKKLYKRRGQTIERVFADFKEHRNLRRFRGRGIARARAQLGFTVLGHNLRLVYLLRNQKKRELIDQNTPQTAA